MSKSGEIMTVMIFGAFLAASVHAAEWQTDFDKAAESARQSGKYMFVNFRGSEYDWCVKLEEEVFATDIFKSYADKNLVLVTVDFSKNGDLSEEQKESNKTLAEKYKVSGYPTVLVFSPDGKVAGKSGYRSAGAEEYVGHLEKLIEKYEKEQERLKELAAEKEKS